MSEGHGSLSSSPPLPDILYAFDGGGEWQYYVPGHDPDELLQIDELESLRWERLWMHPVKASQLDESEIDDPRDTVSRNPKTGRFEPRWCWWECNEDSVGAVPFLGARYLPS